MRHIKTSESALTADGLANLIQTFEQGPEEGWPLVTEIG